MSSGKMTAGNVASEESRGAATESWVDIADGSGAIGLSKIEEFEKSFFADPKNKLARNAVTSNTASTILANREKLQKLDYTFSNKLEELKITNQKRSGRCWIFACMNVLRFHLFKKYELPDDFELSQTYVFFWDKFEKSNFLLENIIATADEPSDSRVVAHLLTDPICDGGQWDMLVNVIAKYGIVPKSVFQETDSSESTMALNSFLLSKLREYSCVLRNLKSSGKSLEDIRAEKDKMMEEVYKILTIHLGTPPKSFDWAYTTKEKKYKIVRDLTPAKFYKEILDIDVSQMVSLINDPRNNYGETYTVDKLGNVVGGQPIRYLNLPVDDLKLYAKKVIDSGAPVWFGCDVGKDLLRQKAAAMDIGILDYELLYGTKCNLSKKDRLLYKQSLMTHAMVFTGYDKREGTDKILRWRVENSWGPDDGDKGYYIMTDDWFSEHMYQVVLDKSLLSPEHLAALDKKPAVLPPWDPMGSLAQN